MSSKIIAFVTAFTMLFLPITASAKGFGGGHSTRSSGSTYSSHSSGFNSYHSGVSNSQTYHSGYRSPSSNVSGSRSYGSNAPSYSTPKSSGGFLSHAVSFGAGALLGSMFHPFGGGYGGYGGYNGFGTHSISIFGLLMDLLLIFIAYKIIRRLFFR
ncbi:hypothetical protein ACQCN2_01780 [Brevibacillus ginsengisoli]|uniref:hypothetical protein n=1 Tax=Brevibacillus ginsengisoli TaxID=363854 RepID=UPI003CEF5BF2